MCEMKSVSGTVKGLNTSSWRKLQFPNFHRKRGFLSSSGIAWLLGLVWVLREIFLSGLLLHESALRQKIRMRAFLPHVKGLKSTIWRTMTSDFSEFSKLEHSELNMCQQAINKQMGYKSVH